jgi:putative Ca2+/H+ antiporter (TMEM165/GDT1 family)
MLNPVIIFPVAGIIFVAELPDKTMVSTLLLAAKYRPIPVWIGAGLAFVIQAAVAVTIGSLISHINSKIISVITGALFLVGGLYLLFSSEKKEEEKGQIIADEAIHKFHKAFFASFGITLIAEFGELTQIMTANLAISYKAPVAVFLGSSLGLITVSGLGAFSGKALSQKLPMNIIRKIAGVIFLSLSILSILRGFKLI